MTAKQVIRRTLKLIEKDGWCQGTLYDYTTGRRCLLGAIDEAAATASYADRQKAIRLLGFEGSMSLYSWNDRPRRRRHDVIERLQKALAKE